MARLTITLPDHTLQALREVASRRGKAVSQLIEESLVAYGIGPTLDVAELVARGRSHAAMLPEDAMALALAETQAVRCPAPERS